MPNCFGLEENLQKWNKGYKWGRNCEIERKRIALWSTATRLVKNCLQPLIWQAAAQALELEKASNPAATKWCIGYPRYKMIYAFTHIFRPTELEESLVKEMILENWRKRVSQQLSSIIMTIFQKMKNIYFRSSKKLSAIPGKHARAQQMDVFLHQKENESHLLMVMMESALSRKNWNDWVMGWKYSRTCWRHGGNH